jgi:hypothetical protein
VRSIGEDYLRDFRMNLPLIVCRWSTRLDIAYAVYS